MRVLMGCVYFLPTEQECTIKNEQSVLELALRHKIDLDHSCGGSGSCGTCRVFLSWRGPAQSSNDVATPPRGDVEIAMAEDRAFAPNERLACQIEPQDGMVITVPEYI